MRQRKHITIALIFSLMGHIAVVGLLLWANSLRPPQAFGEKYAVISVDVISEAGEEEPTKPEEVVPKSPEDQMKIKEKAPPETAMKKESRTIEERDGTGSIGVPGVPGNEGADLVLARIRAKIEAVKRYPRPARRKKIEGRPAVLFQINSDGSIRYVNIARSSGESILDNAALETVKKAAPLPYYEKPIRLKIKYELKEE